MKKDKKLGLEMPENEEERMWMQIKFNLEQELQRLEEALKPKNRLKELKEIHKKIDKYRNLGYHSASHVNEIQYRLCKIIKIFKKQEGKNGK